MAGVLVASPRIRGTTRLGKGTDHTRPSLPNWQIDAMAIAQPDSLVCHS
jgi:hypothetical protein